MSYVEPWMRGPLEGVEPLVQPLLFSFQQAREDLDKWTEGLTPEQMWARPMDLGPVGFHVRHIGGAVERLMVYLEGGQLSEQQLADLKAEMGAWPIARRTAGPTGRPSACGRGCRQRIDPASWTEARFIGRKRLPTTVGGLVAHIAEHTQRHVGEAIVTAKVVRRV